MPNKDQQFTMGKMFAKLEAMHEDISELKESGLGLEKRVRTLENYRWWMAGGVATGLAAPWIVKAMIL